MRRNRTGSSSCRSGPSSTIAAAVSTSAISARGSPRTTSAGRPSPSCASTLSVPMTPFASRAHTYASSFVPRAPPSTAIAPGPCRSRTRLISDGRGVERFRPRHLGELTRLTHHRVEDARVGVHPLDPVPALVAQPSVVHRLGIDAQQPHQAVRRRLQRAPALHRTRDTRGLRGREVPRAGAEAVLARGQRADRTDLHGVAREVRVERLVGEVQHLRAVAAVDEVDQRVARDLVREACAPRALDAPLAVEQDQLAQADRLLPVALLLDEARLARTEGERLVLERALAAPIADGAVERMVDEQELEDTVLDLLHGVGSACGRPCRR